MISDTSNVWVLVNVYQKDLPYVKVGDQVTIQTESYAQSFQGRISFVAAALDPSTRTLQARIETSNPGEKLKKDMYVTASVNAGKIPNAIALPDAAILRDNENQPFVYAAVAGNQFGRRPVDPGRKLQRTNRDHEWIEVRRSSDRRWQLVSAVCKFPAALIAAWEHS